jgi:hypothetical protein
MTFFNWTLWILIGAFTAYGFLKMQSWSVQFITPDRPKFSTGLVIGGAILRWIILFALLAVALHQSLFAALALFGSFMIARLVFLFLFNTHFMPGISPIKGIKD